MVIIFHNVNQIGGRIRKSSNLIDIKKTTNSIVLKKNSSEYKTKITKNSDLDLYISLKNRYGLIEAVFWPKQYVVLFRTEKWNF